MRLCSMLLAAFLGTYAPAQIAVGSKKFTESYVLGEIAKKVLTAEGFTVDHKQGIGATSIVWAALQKGTIDLYPEYTGTISEELLKSKRFLKRGQIRLELAKQGFGITDELGFNNTYALVMRRRDAERLGIKRISDLREHSGLRIKFSQEFLGRKDGWPNLSRRYGLTGDVAGGIDHGLAYEALRDGQIDVTDAYSTDAKIGPYDLLTLDDDLSFFPRYKAVFIYRLSLPARAVAALQKLAETIDERLMIKLNAEAEKTGDFSGAAQMYFDVTGRKFEQAESSDAQMWPNIGRWTAQHLKLVGLSMLIAILIGLPLGIVASKKGLLGQIILGGAGIVQTIPSLALLALLVPIAFFGLTAWTAIFALFLYSLLPIVRNTASGLQDIAVPIRESAAALGLSSAARLFRVFLPMASRSILSGIKTSLIINIGTATLAALIAQGGLGEPIIAGLAINRASLIMQGAVPAAALALLAQMLFELLDRAVIPKGLRIEASAR